MAKFKKLFWGAVLLGLWYLVNTHFALPVQFGPAKKVVISRSSQKTSATAVVIIATSSLYRVVNVVDGDTVDVEQDGVRTRLRLLGMDTPETKDPRKPVQCFGQEASAKAHELLENSMVRLESEPLQTIDKYGRTLAYLFRNDGLFYNQWMIEQGYAHEYTYQLPYRYQQEFRTAEKEARQNERGLWSPQTCGGNTKQAAKK